MAAPDLLPYKIKINVLPKDILNCTLKIANDAIHTSEQEKEIASQIKKMMDNNVGPTWHCIVGRAFGAWVHHENFRFTWFYMDKYGILIYKSA